MENPNNIQYSFGPWTLEYELTETNNYTIILWYSYTSKVIDLIQVGIPNIKSINKHLVIGKKLFDK